MSVAGSSVLDKQSVVSMYEDGLTMRDIADEFGVSTKPVFNIINRKGLSRFAGPESASVNEEFFSNIDSEEKAYCLGMMLSDGCVQKSNVGQKTMGLVLHKQDRDIIESFVKAIQFEGTVFERKPRYVGFNITSAKLFDDLCLLGVVPNKSAIAKAPQLDSKVERHFWRGMFDGDGTICFSGRNIKTAQIRMIGTKTVCQQFKVFCKKNGIETGKIFRTDRDRCVAHVVPVLKKYTQKMTEVFYKRATIHGKRKYNKLVTS